MNTFLSPNFTEGRSQKIQAIVIHIMDGSFTGTRAWFQNPASQVSSHYGLSKKGEVDRYVEDKNTAWHAGRVNKPSSKIVLSMPGVNPNSYTIGIEHEGKPLENDVWTPEMFEASARLIADLCKKYSLAINRDTVIGHYEIYASKPNCPGVEKTILDRLVARAREISTTVPESNVKKDLAQARELLTSALNLIKKYE